jgi:superfamily II DNA/RNA helicase
LEKGLKTFGLTFSRFEEEVIEDIIKPLKNKMKVRNENIQFIFCLATFDQSIQKYIKEEFNNVIQLSSNNLHKTIKNVKHKFIEMKGKDKLEELETILKGDISVRILKFLKKKRTLVFCNTIPCCRAVEHFLNEKGFNVTNFHGEMPPELKEQEFQRFVSGGIQILVTTDIASRGLDTLNVSHVILFDFPESSIDYIHRSGRTGRLGQKGGKVTSFLQKKDLELGNLIEKAIQSGQNLENLSSDKKANDTWKGEKEKEKKEKSMVMGKRKVYMLKKLFSKNLKSKRANQKDEKNLSTSKMKEIFKTK